MVLAISLQAFVCGGAKDSRTEKLLAGEDLKYIMARLHILRHSRLDKVFA